MDHKKFRILGLTIVIVLPVVFFLVFQPLRKVPRPRLPKKYYPLGVKEELNSKGEKVIDSVYHTIPNLKLQTQIGDSLELDSLRGSIYVADFFFASCNGMCPKLSNSLSRVQSTFIKDDNFKIVSFTVDPTNDTIDALRQYSKLYSAIPGKWYFARSSKENIYQLARDGFFVTAKEDDGSGSEAFLHSEKLILVDQNGVIRGYYSGLDSNRVKQLMGDIVLLLRAAEKGFSFRDQKKTTKKLFSN